VARVHDMSLFSVVRSRVRAFFWVVNRWAGCRQPFHVGCDIVSCHHQGEAVLDGETLGTTGWDE
jgi:hypothetical protein